MAVIIVLAILAIASALLVILKPNLFNEGRSPTFNIIGCDEEYNEYIKALDYLFHDSPFRDVYPVLDNYTYVSNLLNQIKYYSHNGININTIESLSHLVDYFDTLELEGLQDRIIYLISETKQLTIDFIDLLYTKLAEQYPS